MADSVLASVSDSTADINSIFHPFRQYGRFNSSLKSYQPLRLPTKLGLFYENVSCLSLGYLRQPVKSFVSLNAARTADTSPLLNTYVSSIRTISKSPVGSANHDPDEVVKSHPTKGELVYIGTLARMVRFVKLFSLSTSVAGVCIQPMIYDQVAELHWALALMVGSVASFFVFVTPFLLHLVTKRYVTRMYWDKDAGRFTATTYSIFLRDIDHSFTAKEVSIPSIPGLFTSIRIEGGKRPLFLDPNLFLSRDALIHLLKYNEPLDWEAHAEQPDSDDEDDPKYQKTEKQKHEESVASDKKAENQKNR